MSSMTDQGHLLSTHNTSRFFVEHPGIAWVLMGLTIVWGVFAYHHMPQRKDPKTPVREALVVAEWPGATTDQVEQLLTKRLEAVVAQNSSVSEIRSVSRPGEAVVNITLDELQTKDPSKEFDDIGIKLSQVGELPQGAGPPQFMKDFGNTAALMLTVASPPVSDVEVSLRAQQLRPWVETALQAHGTSAIIFCYPHGMATDDLRGLTGLLSENLLSQGLFSALHTTAGGDALILSGPSSRSVVEIQQAIRDFAESQIGQTELNPDIWPAIVVQHAEELEGRLRMSAPDKYTYRDLDDYSDQIARSLQKTDAAVRIDRVGMLPEQIHVTYDPSRLAASQLSPVALSDLLHSATAVTSAGEVNTGSRTGVHSETSLGSLHDIAALPLPASAGAPGLLQDVVTIGQGYQTPASYLNDYSYRDAAGTWRRGRAVTITAELRAGKQIAEFSRAVDTDLDQVRKLLPPDLILERTSDQPRQVKENISLFTTSLWEAILLVVVISLIGFWNWRSAALMAISIPITLAMTAGMMAAVGIDLQQVSIASLIIALGLLVDDPVVAGDAIQREVDQGKPSGIAAWLGPTKLARAILFATVTNILAYLPFLLLHGDTGAFIYSLPIVITCSLVASRIVSMSFVPLLGQYLLRASSNATPSAQAPAKVPGRFAKLYRDVGRWSIAHRKAVLGAALLALVGGGALVSRLDSAFFPYDLQYLSYVDIWLPDGASFNDTRIATEQVERTIEGVADKYTQNRDREHPGSPVLKSLTSFVGGGGPRFWDSVSPETPQLNYAEVLIEMRDKHDTSTLVPRLQSALSQRVPGTRIDVRQLETGPPIAAPVEIRILGPDSTTLRTLSTRMQAILRAIPTAARVHDDWGNDRLALALHVDPARAAIAGVTQEDVARSSALATSGITVGSYLKSDQDMPIVLRQQLATRSKLSDVANQYVYSSRDHHSVSLEQVASVALAPQVSQVRHFDRSRAITVSCYPVEGAVASSVLNAAQPKIDELVRTLPPGYSLVYAGEYKEQNSGFADLAVSLSVSILAIYLALMLQFKNAVKPLIVFAAIPFGCVGAFVALFVMRQPFGFMAFLGVASLIGVVVSHIIVLFDYIEEQHQAGEPFMDALLDAGMLRLRPVLITVGATVFALFPLAVHGGPLWEPLCYAQIGGLLLSTLVTLLLVPTLYAFVVLDLGWVRWETNLDHINH